MSVPRIMVVAGDSFSSRAIEGFGGGRWSHMANVLSDGTILDARDNAMDFGSERVGAGVALRPRGYLDSQSRWAVFEAPTGDKYGHWEKAGRSQLGKPYDSVGILDFASGLFTDKYRDRNYAPRTPGQSKAWFCDELSTWMAMTSRYLQWFPFPIYTLTPGSALNLFIGAGWHLTASKGL